MEWTLIFDWGGVLASSDYIIATKYLSDKYQGNQTKLEELLRAESTFSVSNDYSGFTERITKEFGIPEEDIIDAKNKTVPDKTLDFCHSLNGSGYVLYLLSDQMQFRTDYITQNFDLSCFKEVFFSSDIGHMKNEKKAFEYVIDKTNIDPSKTIFIDDNPNNIVVAESTGLKGILYTNLPELKDKLRQFHVALVNDK